MVGDRNFDYIGCGRGVGEEVDVSEGEGRMICSICNKEIKPLESYGMRERPLCFDCYSKEEDAKKEENKNTTAGSTSVINHPKIPHDGVAICLTAFAGLEILGAIVLFLVFWLSGTIPGKIAAVAFLSSGVLFGLLFVAAAKTLDYLKKISESLLGRKS